MEIENFAGFIVLLWFYYELLLDPNERYVKLNLKNKQMNFASCLLPQVASALKMLQLHICSLWFKILFNEKPNSKSVWTWNDSLRLAALFHFTTHRVTSVMWCCCFTSSISIRTVHTLVARPQQNNKKHHSAAFGVNGKRLQ